MIVGVPKEIKEGEKRVAVTPQGVDALVSHRHRVLLEKGAGEGSGFSNRGYEKAGAIIVERREDVWNEADIIVKVKGTSGGGISLDETRTDPLHLSPSGC